MKKEIFLPVFIFGLAFFLLFYKLGERSLWEDEARTLLRSLWSFEAILLYSKNVVFNIILSAWSRFGKDELWLRIPSALFALFSLAAFYELGKKLFSRTTSLMATLLLTLSPLFLFECRQVKPYSLAIFFSITSVYFLIHYVETGRSGALLGHLGLSLMGFLTHYMFLPVTFAQFLFLLLGPFKNRQNLLRRYLLVLLPVSMLLPLLLPDLMDQFSVLGTLYLHPGTPEVLSFPLGTLGKIAFVYYFFTVGPTIFPWALFWVIPGSVLPALLLMRSLKSATSRYFSLVFLAFCIPFLFSSFLRNMQPRYALVALPFYCLLLAVGLSHVRPLFRIFFFAGLVVLNTYGLSNYFSGRQYLFIAHLEPYREIVQLVKKEFKEGDYMLHSQRNSSFNYYLHALFGKKVASALLAFTDLKKGGIHLRTWKEIQHILPPDVKRLWFIERPPGQFVDSETPIPDPEELHQKILAFRIFLDSRFTRLERWTFLEDPDVGKKERFFRKFYLRERIVVSLYDLTAP